MALPECKDDYASNIRKWLDRFRNEIIEECAVLAETLKEDRFGKLPQFQVADAIRKLKVEK